MSLAFRAGCSAVQASGRQGSGFRGKSGLGFRVEGLGLRGLGFRSKAAEDCKGYKYTRASAAAPKKYCSCFPEGPRYRIRA